jgi:2-dehydropantoate 2-reductase
MRILVFGAGAIGTLFGGLLSRSHSVVLLGREAPMKRVARDGVRIESEGETVRGQPETCSALSPEEMVDVVAITVKAFDLEEACQEIARLRHPPRWVLCLQNGIGNEEILRSHFPPETIVRGLVYNGAFLCGGGVVLWTGKGPTFIGRPLLPTRGEGDGELEALAQTMTESGFPAKVAHDVQKEIWRKLVVNAALNPLGAITGLPNGAIPRSSMLTSLLRQIVGEVETVAYAERGYRFDLADRTLEIALRTGANRNSMLLDLESRGQTEIEFLSGAVVRMARRHGIAVPANETLFSLIRGKQEAIRHGWGAAPS